MRRILMLAGMLAGFSACAQMNSDAERTAASEALQADPAIAAETQALNQLTRVVIDANRLYDQAADEAEDVQLQAALRAISDERKRFAQGLQRRVAALGGQPAETGRVSGAIHRSFSALRRLVDNNPVAAAEEVYRGESHIVEQMDKVLLANLTAGSRSMVQAELARVRANRDNVQEMQSQIAARLADEAVRERTAEQATTNPG